jgi:hypothetical protein
MEVIKYENKNVKIFDSYQKNTIDARVLMEDELEYLSDLLIDYPKTKAYIRQSALIFPMSKKTIEKSINAKQVIENTLFYFSEEDITFAINQTYKYNKGRPTPMQVVAILTGDTEGNLKKKMMTDKKEAEDTNEIIDGIISDFKKMNWSAWMQYIEGNKRKEVIKNKEPPKIEIIDELMKNLIELQAYLLTYFKRNKANFHNIGLSTHFSHIPHPSTKETNLNSNYLTYLRSNEFKNFVLQGNYININIPNCFVNYVK